MMNRRQAGRDYQESLLAQKSDKDRQTLDVTLVLCVAAAAELGWAEDDLVALRSQIARALNPEINLELPPDAAQILAACRAGDFVASDDPLSMALKKVSDVVHPLDRLQ